MPTESCTFELENIGRPDKFNRKTIILCCDCAINEIKCLFEAKAASKSETLVNLKKSERNIQTLRPLFFPLFYLHLDGGKEFQCSAKLKHEARSAAREEYESFL